jgi:hypothetical protein
LWINQKELQRLSRDLATEYETRLDIDTHLLLHSMVIVLCLLVDATHMRRCLAGMLHGLEAGLGISLIDRALQPPDDRLCRGEVSRA